MLPPPQTATATVSALILRHGLPARILRPRDVAPSDRLHEFLAAGRHGTMGWLADTAERRTHPNAVWPEARSIIMVAMNYGPRADPLADLDRADRGTISVYARHRDYHDVLKGRLKVLAGEIAARTGGDVKVFVDTAPVMEKPLAERAGLGWQGKHTNLVSRYYGSWLFLGAIFTTLELEPDPPETDHCGSCRRCLDICPTDAFPAPYQLDARRCISYLTIEHKGMIPREFRRAMGNRIYGCDDCLAVCPWNKFAREASEAKLAEPEGSEAPRLADLAGLDDAAFRQRFSGSPVKRIGRDRFVRNVMVAIGNARDPAFAPLIEARLSDASPLVRAAAVWAAGEALAPPALAALAARHAPDEPERVVRAEWDALAPAMEPSHRRAGQRSPGPQRAHP
jgi:epoxyqueuosine reductase